MTLEGTFDLDIVWRQECEILSLSLILYCSFRFMFYSFLWSGNLFAAYVDVLNKLPFYDQNHFF
jgi:hypothetical protein